MWKGVARRTFERLPFLAATRERSRAHAVDLSCLLADFSADDIGV